MTLNTFKFISCLIKYFKVLWSITLTFVLPLYYTFFSNTFTAIVKGNFTRSTEDMGGLTILRVISFGKIMKVVF
jgi:hypothetical protein